MVEISSNQLIIGTLSIAFLVVTSLLFVSAYRHVLYLVQKRWAPSVPVHGQRRRRSDDDNDGDDDIESEVEQVGARRRGGRGR